MAAVHVCVTMLVIVSRMQKGTGIGGTNAPEVVMGIAIGVKIRDVSTLHSCQSLSSLRILLPLIP